MYTSADRVRRVLAERGHDLAAVGVADDDGRAFLTAEHVAEARDVVGKRRLRELRCDDVEALGLQLLDNGAPARAIRPCPVDTERRSVGQTYESFRELVRKKTLRGGPTRRPVRTLFLCGRNELRSCARGDRQDGEGGRADTDVGKHFGADQ